MIQQKAGEWLLTQLKPKIQSRPSSSNSNNAFPFGGNLGSFFLFINYMHYIHNSFIDPLFEDEVLQTLVSRNQREKVRDYIEHLLANLLKGPLDDVSVGQLYTHGSCE